MTSIIEIALLDYFDVHAPERGRQGAKAPQKDIRLREEYRNLSFIAQLYQFWAGAFNAHSAGHRTPWKPTWTDRDETAYQEIKDYDERAVELSIIQVVTTKRLGSARIIAFRYFLPQIHSNIDDQMKMPTAKLSWILNHYRHKAADYLKTKRGTDWLNCDCCPEEKNR